MPQQGDHLTTSDVVVIGLGTTGTAALEAAVETGVTATGLELLARPGLPLASVCEYDTRAWGIFGDGTLVSSGPGGTRRRRARAIVIATGAIDLPLPLPGWDLGGVTGAYLGARTLAGGTEVVVLRGPHARRGDRSPNLSHLSVTLDHDLSDGTAVSMTGGSTVESIVIADHSVATRHVLLDNGLQPENTLARMTGVPSRFSVAAGGDVIMPGSVVALQGTLLAVVGDAAGISDDDAFTLREARETGRLLAESILGGPIPVGIQDARPGWTEGGVPTLPRQTTDATLVCPDEGIAVGMVREAIRRGAATVNDVKRRTRAAMATCQGRDCLWTIRALLAEANRDYTTPMTARPPVTGITVSELAGLATTD